MATDYRFEGWVGQDVSSAEGNMQWMEFTPKAWEETDADIKVTHAGICGTDIHTLRSGWVSIISRPRNVIMTRIQVPVDYPVVVGHEIAGQVARVGSQAGNLKVGDIVGVGPRPTHVSFATGPATHVRSIASCTAPRRHIPTDRATVTETSPMGGTHCTTAPRPASSSSFRRDSGPSMRLRCCARVPRCTTR